jgi:hypothetical protein
MKIHRPRRNDAVAPFNGIRFMIASYLSGAAIGVIFATAILVSDLGGLRTLMGGDGGWVAMAMLEAAMAFTFAGLYAGVAIMLGFRGDGTQHPEPTDE